MQALSRPLEGFEPAVPKEPAPPGGPRYTGCVRRTAAGGAVLLGQLYRPGVLRRKGALMPKSPPSHIDPYIAHCLAAAAEEESAPDGFPNDVAVPLLILVRDAGWNSKTIPGFTEASRLGHVITGTGTARCVEILSRDAGVLSVEGSRLAGTHDCAASLPLVGADIVHKHPLAEDGEPMPHRGNRQRDRRPCTRPFVTRTAIHASSRA
jgi:hypothetical protein